MLVVDPMKRLTVQDLLQHRWVNESLPPYLARMKSQLNPARNPDTLTGLLDATADETGPDWIADIGHLDNAILRELEESLEVDASVVRSALDMEGENAVKVAYKLIQDRVSGQNLDAVGKRPTPPSSASAVTQPMWIPPSGPKSGAYSDVAGTGEDLFTEGEGGYTEDDDDDEDGGLNGVESGEFDSSVSNGATSHNFHWLDTSLVHNANSASSATMTGLSGSPAYQGGNHHLAHYANSRSALNASSSRTRVPLSPSGPGGTAVPTSHSHSSRRTGRHGQKDKDHYPRQPRWHFGIRSSSPPMEVMLELYRTLEALQIQWRQKKGLWSASREESHAALVALEQGLHGEDVVANGGDPGSAAAAGDSYEGEPRENLDVYYVECRWRVRDTVLLFDLQLYQVDAMNYLVDFRDLGYYAAAHPLTQPPLPNRFDPADRDSIGEDGLRKKKDGDFPHPLLFLECACRLIIELAGGAG
ncbi:hypothetical protein DL93DRAFT_2082774 [Clavulina sp. PMI_390]|nr:hypothetical protein DL93DRAFT_2082774 [Clavulina sp. PMI_390]